MNSKTEIEKAIAELGAPPFPASPSERAAWKRDNPEKAAAMAHYLRMHEEAERIEREEEVRRGIEKANVIRLEGLVGSRIVRVLREAKLDHPALGEAARWDRDPVWSLLLIGNVGTGKSVAAGWLAQQAIQRGASVVWLRAPEVGTAAAFGEQATSLKERARRTSLLVIDDLGAEVDGAYFRCWLEDVLGFRHAHEQRTVLTTNLDRQTLGDRLGQRLLDRLREGATFSMNSPSMRQPRRRAS